MVQSPWMTGWKRVGVATVAVVLAASPSWAAVSAPFSEDFNDAAAPDFSNYRYNNGKTSTWTLAGGAYQHASEVPGSGAQQFATAVVQANNLAAPSDFVVQITANVSEANSTSTNSIAKIGLVGLAKNANGGQWNNDALYYAGELVVAGTDSSQTAGALHIRRGRGNNSAETIATGVSLPSFALSDTFVMTLSGTYDQDGDLTLSFTVNGTTITTEVAAANVYTGQYFGIRDYTDNNRNLAVTYDNFSLSNVIPEPASAALITLGGVLMLRRRHA